MGLQTLIEGGGDKKPHGGGGEKQHRRGDVALIVSAVLSLFELYRQVAPPAAQAAVDDSRVVQILADMNQLKAESVATRIDLGVLKEKVRALESKR